MAAELRLILLGLGVALVVGLWWWERRRSVDTGTEGPARNPELFEPRLEPEPHATAAAASPPVLTEPTLLPTEMDTQEMPARRAPVLERPVPRGDPPVLTIEGLPEDTVEVELAEPEPASAARPVVRPVHGRSGQDRRRPVADPPVIDLPVAEPADDEPSEEEPADEEPAGRAPIEAEPAPAVDMAAEPEPDGAPVETPPRHQRIIAVRLISRGNERIGGRELKAALSGEGLEHGRYSIFHRLVEGGRPLYSVASLVEPGSFDPNTMDSLRYPGISLFAVFPGPLPAPQCFDELLATARRLADRLGATLQDDAGSSLTGQRVLSIREDLVHFEHLVSLSRSRPRA